jgi:hypothetical protein
MSHSGRSALLLKVIEEALGALEPLSASQEALRFEREADALRATVESWREAPPSSVSRRAIMQRVLRLHSEATKYARQGTTPEAATAALASGPEPAPSDADENERPTIPPQFSMAAFAWDMTAPDSGRRPKSDPPTLWRSVGTEPFAMDVEVDDALAGLDDSGGALTAPAVEEKPRLSPSSIERAVVGLVEDSASSVISQRKIEDPTAYVLERYRTRDYEAALEMADLILTKAPGNLLVRQCRDKCRDALAKVCAKKIRPLDRIPVLVALPAPIDTGAMDHRAGFLLSLVDGSSTLEAIVDVCGMPRSDALRVLDELVQRGVIRVK